MPACRPGAERERETPCQQNVTACSQSAPAGGTGCGEGERAARAVWSTEQLYTYTLDCCTYSTRCTPRSGADAWLGRRGGAVLSLKWGRKITNARGPVCLILWRDIPLCLLKRQPCETAGCRAASRHCLLRLCVWEIRAPKPKGPIPTNRFRLVLTFVKYCFQFIATAWQVKRTN